MFRSSLKRFTVFAAFTWRLGVIVIILVFNNAGGFSKSETWQLVSMVLPVSCFYIATALNFNIRNKNYLIRKEKVTQMDAFWSVFIHLVYGLQLAALVAKAFFGLATATLVNTVLITECVCAIYGGLFLSNLLGTERSSTK